MKIVKAFLKLSICLFFINAVAQKTKPNVLFIMVDDLRPELGCYGNTEIKSPNIDALASKALIFNNAYCNIPVCGASRASLMTGILPTKNRFVQYHARADEDAPNVKTLPQLFKESGYTTLSIGKVFHNPEDSNKNSWSKPAWLYQGKNYDFKLSKDPSTLEKLSKRKRGRFYEMPNVEDSAYNDGQTALKTIESLQNIKKTNNPFFITCGFIRPHLPFYAPKKYWNLYNTDSITQATNFYRPKNAPKSLKGSGEIWGYHLGGINRKSEEFRKTMKHGYYASVSYTDKLIGDVLAELKRLELDKNTIIVLWGDHGWHLGEHSFWSKHNTMNLALKIPLIIKTPNNSISTTTNAIVESVDIYPTLCKIAGIKPENTIHGKSFIKLLEQPDTNFRDYAYSRFLTADAITTDRYSFTFYDTKPSEMMLYDHLTDPNENNNVAYLPEYQKVVKKLKKLISKSKKRASY